MTGPVCSPRDEQRMAAWWKSAEGWAGRCVVLVLPKHSRCEGAAAPGREFCEKHWAVCQAQGKAVGAR